MEHVEKTGIHSGDSISIYPTFSITKKTIEVNPRSSRTIKK